jgi:pimeloyl-ACP methyl ester carboxylesterase
MRGCSQPVADAGAAAEQESSRLRRIHRTHQTLKGYQALRPSLDDFKEQMAKCTVPTLIISGDEDEPCLDASLLLKRRMPSAGLVFMPQTGHVCNLEEPELFNMACEKFFHQVESGQYRMRDPRATPDRIF